MAGWHQQPFKRLGVAGASAEVPDDVREEVTQRDLEVAEFMGTTTKAMEELERRVLALEQERER